MGSGIVSFDPADQFAAREWLFDALKVTYLPTFHRDKIRDRLMIRLDIDTSTLLPFTVSLSPSCQNMVAPTAAFTGTEASVGVAVRKSGIPRHEVFVTTKLP